jgi:hypothetical protein
VHVAGSTGTTVFGLVVTHVLKRKQGIEIVDNLEDDVPATATIATVRAAPGTYFSRRNDDEPFPPLPALTKIFA